MPKNELTPPKEDPIQVAENYDRTITIPGAYTAFRDAVVANAAEISAITYPDPAGLKVGTAALTECVDIIKTVEKVEADHREPVNKWLKDIRKKRDDFLASVMTQKERLTGIINHYRRKEIDEQQRQEREAMRLKREAEEAVRKAEQDAANAKTEEAKLDAELAAETAKEQVQAAEMSLMAPKDTPKGLVTRVRFDFEIIDWRKFISTSPEVWTWDKENEVAKIDRRGLLKLLNADDENPWKECLPIPEQDSATHDDLGIRIFKGISIYTR